ncbi:MAG: tRNA (adenosine(37)-N6)-dimethylallyltransferase MiaA [Coriobacteriia bacterium]
MRVLAIVGPTAVGKTALADRLASLARGEVVSADSMQVYRGMDVGTAKPSCAERSVAYHCLDLIEPGEPYSAALFQSDARSAIDDIAGRGCLPVVTGGTGLYVRAALDDMRFPQGELHTEARRRLEALADQLGPEGIHDVLADRDPESAALIHPHNLRRTIRALEMAEQGVSYAEQAARFRERHAIYDTFWLGLDMQREALYARIDARVDDMIAAGLIEEVRRLLDEGYRCALTATQAIGYKELVPVLEGRADVSDAVAAIKQATRRYAKRQLTWFRSDPRVNWLDVTDSSPAESVERARALIESWAPGLLGA